MSFSQEAQQKLEEIENEMAHLIADALFSFLKRHEERKEAKSAANF